MIREAQISKSSGWTFRANKWKFKSVIFGRTDNTKRFLKIKQQRLYSIVKSQWTNVAFDNINFDLKRKKGKPKSWRKKRVFSWQRIDSCRVKKNSRNFIRKIAIQTWVSTSYATWVPTAIPNPRNKNKVQKTVLATKRNEKLDNSNGLPAGFKTL